MAGVNSKDDMDVLNQIFGLLQPLSSERRAKVVQVLATLLDIRPTVAARTEDRELGIFEARPSASRVPFSTELKASPKEFLVQKQPKTDVERVACLAYYLTHYRDTPHFKTIDLSKLNTEAAQPRLSNPNYASRNAVTYGYLAPATKGQKQLSAAGEQFVSALPDRTAAKDIMNALMRRRRKTRKKEGASVKSRGKAGG